jgi:hypothetical protein
MDDVVNSHSKGGSGMENLATICSYVLLKKNELQGFKSLQKILYFITASGVPTGLLYSLNSKGPYSSKLDYNIDNLELMGVLRIGKTDDKYRILPGDRAEVLIENRRWLIEKHREMMDSLLENLPEDPLELEFWAAVHYVVDVQKGIYGQMDESEIVKEVNRVLIDYPGERRIIEILNNMCGLGLIR